MKTLRQIQTEVNEWDMQNFGPNNCKDRAASHFALPLNEIPDFYGMVSEMGELAALDARAMQGRSKISDAEGQQAAREDALADLMIFMCAYANRRGIDLIAVLNRTWEKVQKRRQETWEQDKSKESQ